ncbi:hypothetical protein PFISCL1PPCAC_3898, partial [Pristionchus fissidentatus]
LSKKTHLTDLGFVVDGKKLYAGKDFMCLHWPYLNSLFYGGFADGIDGEFELTGVSHNEFLALLRVLYQPFPNMNEEESDDLLALGEKFGIELPLEDDDECDGTLKFDFTSSSKIADLVLFVEGKKIYVKRQLLSIVSPVFRRMLDEDPEEITIDDVKYEGFIDFLLCVYPSYKRELEGPSMEPILKLSMRFNVQFLRDFIIHSMVARSEQSFSPERLTWAFEYDVDMELRSQDYREFHTVQELLG